jgi:enoyl-CoA hydratase/carnithine racemase
LTREHLVEQREAITIITIDRPEVRNAVDRETADRLAEAVEYETRSGLAVIASGETRDGTGRFTRRKGDEE